MERVENLMSFDVPVNAADGTAYRARARARERDDDGLWEAWIEFSAVTGAEPLVVATPRETTQPNLEAARYWATGLSHVFLEGALARARDTVVSHA